MRKTLERALWAAIILGSIWILLAVAATANAAPPPRHAYPAKGNLPALRLSLLRPHLRRAIPPQ